MRTSAVETETSDGAVVELATYVYDVRGNLLSESVTSGGTTTVRGFAYTPDGTLYADVGSGGAMQTRSVSGVGGPDTCLARVTSGGGGAWLLSDYQGSIMLVVGLTGGVQDSIIYDGFGDITSETNPGARGELGFQGGRYDTGTGNWEFGVREYAPCTQQWTTTDPTGLGPDSNPSRFTGNDPTNATDPNGLDLIPDDERYRRQWIKLLTQHYKINIWYRTYSDGRVSHICADPLETDKITDWPQVRYALKIKASLI